MPKAKYDEIYQHLKGEIETTATTSPTIVVNNLTGTSIALDSTPWSGCQKILGPLASRKDFV
mgnify:CR=1 FL=1